MTDAEQPVEEEAAADPAAAAPDPHAVEEAAEVEVEDPPVEDEDPSVKAEKYLALAQRTQADFENYRKRMTRETAAAADRGIARVVKEVLPALDHLELALQAAESHDAGDWTKGIRGIQDELLGALARVGIEPFSPLGEVFDPTEHEAMVQQPSEEAEAGTVLQVYQQGYRLGGQVLRPARVVVAGGG